MIFPPPCGYDSQVYLATTQVDCYAKLRLLSYAEQVFDEMIARNLVTDTECHDWLLCEEGATI
jgi:pentatricopeptide repeat protein